MKLSELLELVDPLWADHASVTFDRLRKRGLLVFTQLDSGKISYDPLCIRLLGILSRLANAGMAPGPGTGGDGDYDFAARVIEFVIAHPDWRFVAVTGDRIEGLLMPDSIARMVPRHGVLTVIDVRP
jgi:hypothetical protein